MLSLRQIGVVSSLAVSSSALAQNAVQWRVQDGGNGHWYAGVATSPTGASWSAARAQLVQMGADLATIPSQACASWLFANVVDNPTLWSNSAGPWIGGLQQSDAAEPEGGWTWIDGTPILPGLWSPGQPDNALNCGGDNDRVAYWNAGQGAPRPYLEDSPDAPVTPCGVGARIAAVAEWSADCNSDGIVDFGQIHTGELADTNANNIPDCCETGSPCSANILVNGSFELGDAQSCGWVCMGTGDLRLVGWNVVLNSVDRQRTEPDGCNEGWFASHGNYSVDLNGCSVGGIIRQVAPTQVGETYRLSFDLTLNAANVEIGRLRVRAGEAVHDFEYQRRPTNPQPSEHHEFEFDAVSGATGIEFESLNREYPEQWNGPVVDAIRLEQIINPCPAKVCVVPTDFATIQDAIDAAPVGQHRIIEVLGGIYNQSFALNGKNVVIRGAADGSTILDGGGLTGSIAKLSGEPASAGLENLVFRNGTTGSRFTPDATFTVGGAIYANSTAAYIRNCRFESCRADFGGAIYQYAGSIAWDNCVFTGNIANSDGGGAQTYNCTGMLRNCTFTGNRCGMNGPGSGSGYKAIGSNGEGETVTIDSCAFSGNIAGDSGSAIEFYEHVKFHPGVLQILNTSITGNISGEPIPSGTGGVRVLGRQSSCLIGAGTVICGNTQRNVSGPYLASGSPTICDCLADLSGDGVVNAGDLGLLLSSWGIAGSAGNGDVNRDGVVNAQDLGELLANWGICD